MSQEGRQVFETFTEARLPAMEEGGQKKLDSKSRSRCRGLYNLPTVLYRSRDHQSPVKQQAMGQLAGLSDRGGIGGVSILVVHEVFWESGCCLDIKGELAWWRKRAQCKKPQSGGCNPTCKV